MWKRPWNLKEGLCIGGGLFLTGLLLQNTVGKIDWNLLSWPVNIILFVLYVILLTGMHLGRRRVYLFNWMSHYTAALSSLLWVGGITVVMGLIRQLPFREQVRDPLGFSQMLSSWPFFLLYFWMVSVLGLVLLRAGIPYTWRRLCFWLNHMGLFLVLSAATLGSADMQRVNMNCRLMQAEWRATDKQGRMLELPLAIELQNFTIDEYPPKLMAIDNETGQALPLGKPQHLLLENGVKEGTLLNWQIEVLQSIPEAASVATEDTLKFVEFHSLGAAYAVYLAATHLTTNEVKKGWVSCGSFLFPYRALRLDAGTSIVMPEREPQRFVSGVKVYTKSQKIIESTIEVNHPLSVEGWDIYQLSYEEDRGKWSETSIFELVYDPWLPVVYAGIWMLLAGAVCLFITAQKRKGETDD